MINHWQGWERDTEPGVSWPIRGQYCRIWPIRGHTLITASLSSRQRNISETRVEKEKWGAGKGWSSEFIPVFISVHSLTGTNGDKWAAFQINPNPNKLWLVNYCHSPLGWHGENVPLDTLIELRQVDTEVDDCQVLDLILVSQIDLDRERYCKGCSESRWYNGNNINTVHWYLQWDTEQRQTLEYCSININILEGKKYCLQTLF